MEIFFDIVHYGLFAVCGLFGLLVVAALLFGKRVEKKWDFEADFRDSRGREIGEFDIELQRVIEDPKAAVQPDFKLDAKFKLRHPALSVGQSVSLSLQGEVLFDAVVATEGHIYLTQDDLDAEIKDPAAGQIVSVEVGGSELFSQPLRTD